ncbi:hypothetical protein SANA_14030 [Gottschalkiaceae bacterium SANA]|nr:hypothetical protein SANA_14030 [Gottschalkiaceae bacterium SANA]
MKLKKTIVPIIGLLMLFATVAFATEYKDGDFKFSATADSATVIGYTSIQAREYVIPSITLGEIPVTRIGRYAFNYWDDATGIVIPDSIKVIEQGAFKNARAITSIDIPNSVVSVEPQAFMGAWKAESLHISESMTRIQDFSFAECFNLKNVVIPDNIVSIGEGAFQLCNRLVGIEIPDSVTRIAISAFEGCDDLQSFTFPAGITSVSSKVLKGCTELTEINLPEGVTGIGQYAFFYCRDLESIELPNTLTKIEGFAFSTCMSLKSITIPENVTYIRTGAFDQCDELKKITILNREMVINDMITEGTDQVVIHGYANSTAQAYANENDIPFVALMELYTPSVGVVAPVNTGVLTPIGSDMTQSGGLGDVTLPTGQEEQTPPTIANPLQDINNAKLGAERRIDFSLAFANGGNQLTFTSNKGTIDGLSLVYTPVRSDVVAGKIIMQITAMNSSGQKVTDEFAIKLAAENHAPLVVNPIPDQSDAKVGQEIAIDLLTVFRDEDGDPLTFAVSTGGIFKQSSHLFSYTPHAVQAGSNQLIRVRAIDTEHGVWVEDSFILTIASADIQPPALTRFTAIGVFENYPRIQLTAEQNEEGLIYVAILPEGDLTVVDKTYMSDHAMKIEVGADELIEKEVSNTNLLVGTYTVHFMAEDMAGNLSSVSKIEDVMIAAPLALTMPLEINVQVTHVTYAGESNGSLTITPNAANACEYEVNGVWTDENKQTHLRAGTYHVRARVKDQPENVTEIQSVEIMDGPEIETVSVFDDSTNHWGKIAIGNLATRGIIKGKSKTAFGPDDTITKAEFVTLMVRYFAMTSDQTESYLDVFPDDWYAKNIAIAKDNRIIPDVYGKFFKAEDAITRQDMMYILHRSILLSGQTIPAKHLSLNDFTDRSAILDYALEGAEYLVSRDIIHGYDHKINPTATSTRAEVAQMLYNLTEK